MYRAKAYAAASARAPFQPTTIDRRDPTERDVRIDILYCGICHSDLHHAHDDWGRAQFPLVPGHEIVGRVSSVGASVTRHRVGDVVAVGCLVGSDQTCPACRAGLEQFCAHQTIVFGSPDEHLGGHTLGGFSESIVVDERFVLRVPAGLDLAAAAPLLCAGITTYSPLRHWKVDATKSVGIVGLGGLGHLGVKFARAMGARVVVITSSPRKTNDALKLGAHDVVMSSDADAMKRHAGSLDLIVDTVSGDHDVAALLTLLRHDGNLTLVGLPTKPLSIPAFSLIVGRRGVSGSNIGGIAETQEMLEFSAAHGITADIELIQMQAVNEALERLARGDVKYRFVIDMKSLAA